MNTPGFSDNVPRVLEPAVRQLLTNSHPLHVIAEPLSEDHLLQIKQYVQSLLISLLPLWSSSSAQLCKALYTFHTFISIKDYLIHIYTPLHPVHTRNKA